MDAEGNILPHDGRSTGEVVMRAPWLTRSYFKAPDKTKELWHNGWLHSGDVGYIDEAGYLKITDRIKDVIKSGGEWISSLDLENIMSQHPAVAETAAVGVPDAKWGERPLVLVTLKPEHQETLDVGELKGHMLEASAAGALPKYAVPDHYLVVDEIPKTSVGKIDKKRIRQDYPAENP
jgi:fatty-acyl-CoA synthase